MSDDLRELYQDLILDHSKHPHNFRLIENPTHEAVGHNPLCGDKLVLYMNMGHDGIIKDVSFQGSGCAISTASASMMTDMLVGKTIEEAQKLFAYFHKCCTGDDTADAAGLVEDDVDHLQALSGVRSFPIRVKCATLAWHTLEAAIENAKKATTE